MYPKHSRNPKFEARLGIQTRFYKQLREEKGQTSVKFQAQKQKCSLVNFVN